LDTKSVREVKEEIPLVSLTLILSIEPPNIALYVFLNFLTASLIVSFNDCSKDSTFFVFSDENEMSNTRNEFLSLVGFFPISR
jgi:hypothetical protein